MPAKNKIRSFTEGPLYKSILFFSLPLMASQILQVLFNISDVIIVGKGIADSTVPVGAVGSTSTLLTLFTGFLIGLGAGINVKVAQYLGANKDDDVKKTVNTALILSVCMGLVIFAASFFFARGMLELLKTKDELLDKAVIYLKIYSCGMPALAIFNYGNGVLSAAGDTKRPLIYLTISGLLNIALNLFFVLRCGLDVEGVALASVITQYLSAIAVTVRLLNVKGAHKLEFKGFSADKKKTGEILGLGIPAGLQNAVFSVANMFIQVGINSFPYKEVTGITTAMNIDTVIYNVMAAFNTACSTFIGQNYGAVAVFKGDLILALFDPDPEVIAAGMEKMKIMGFSFCLAPFMDNTIAASRGIGKSLVPTIMVILGSCVFRVIWIFTIFAQIGTIVSLFLLYPISWAITAIAEIIYFAIAFKRTNFAPKTDIAVLEADTDTH